MTDQQKTMSKFLMTLDNPIIINSCHFIKEAENVSSHWCWRGKVLFLTPGTSHSDNEWRDGLSWFAKYKNGRRVCGGQRGLPVTDKSAECELEGKVLVIRLQIADVSCMLSWNSSWKAIIKYNQELLFKGLLYSNNAVVMQYNSKP